MSLANRPEWVKAVEVLKSADRPGRSGFSAFMTVDAATIPEHTPLNRRGDRANPQSTAAPAVAEYPTVSDSTPPQGETQFDIPPIIGRSGIAHRRARKKARLQEAPTSDAEIEAPARIPPSIPLELAGSVVLGPATFKLDTEAQREYPEPSHRQPNSTPTLLHWLELRS